MDWTNAMSERKTLLLALLCAFVLLLIGYLIKSWVVILTVLVGVAFMVSNHFAFHGDTSMARYWQKLKAWLNQ